MAMPDHGVKMRIYCTSPWGVAPSRHSGIAQAGWSGAAGLPAVIRTSSSCVPGSGDVFLAHERVLIDTLYQ